jgi:hypothetical protein
MDGAGNPADLLSLAVQTVAALLRLHVPTLIVCSMGLSRAPALAAAALAVVHGETPADCLQRVLAQHPGDVSPGLWNELTAVLPLLQ